MKFSKGLFLNRLHFKMMDVIYQYSSGLKKGNGRRYNLYGMALEIGITYSHLIKLKHQFTALGLVDGKRFGREHKIFLTPKGIELRLSLCEVLKILSPEEKSLNMKGSSSISMKGGKRGMDKN